MKTMKKTAAFLITAMLIAGPNVISACPPDCRAASACCGGDCCDSGWDITGPDCGHRCGVVDEPAARADLLDNSISSAAVTVRKVEPSYAAGSMTPKSVLCNSTSPGVPLFLMHASFLT